MAVFKFDSKTSIFSTAVDAFTGDSAGPDTLTVEAGGFVIATGAGNDAAILANTGAWTVNVNGSVFSEQALGIWLQFGNLGVSTIKVGADAEVAGVFGLAIASTANITNAGNIYGHMNAGIGLSDNAVHNITNSGTVSGKTHSIQDLDAGAGGVENVKNSGLLFGLVDLANGNDKLTNSGVINGNVLTGKGVDTFSNSKTISGTVDLGDDDDKGSNSGIVANDFTGGNGNDVLTNSGFVGDDVNLGTGKNVFTNSGTVGDDVTGSSDVDKVTNSKLIMGSVVLGDGDNVLNNSGTINGGVGLGNGNDKFTNTGTVVSVINLGDGSDTFIGGAKVETVLDNDGADNIKLGGGNDIYVAVGASADSTDTIDGGAGIDTYDASTAPTAAISINIDTVDHDRTPISPAVAKVVANTATGVDVAGVSLHDTVTGFENVKGTDFSDNIYGNAAANLLEGNLGSDWLWGFAGKDTLVGGEGTDRVIGGAGADVLAANKADGSGDGANDTFYFVDKADSGVTVATRDLILDFEDTKDKIELSKIDAIPGGADDPFGFLGVGKSFTGTAGQLRAYQTAGGWVVDADITGDGKADFAIGIFDPTHAITIDTTDFAL